MNNEIKEILKDDDELLVNYKDGSFESFDTLPKNVLDYITNLQEENKELNDDNIWWNNRFKAVERDKREYKARIDKAIEYITTHKYPTMYGFSNDDLDKNDLLNILQGEKNE